MRSTLVMLALLVLMAGLGGGAAACINGGGNASELPEQRSVDASHTGKTVEIAAGGSLTVTLESNITTGFQWQMVGNTDEAVLALEDRQYQASDEARAGVVGAGGQEVWTFKALDSGESTIDLEYSQPWEGGTNAVGTFVLTVVVE